MKGFAWRRHFRGMMRILSVAFLSMLLLTQPGGARLPAAAEALPLINELDVSIQERLHNARPETLGMSRIMRWPSLGEHFVPVITDKRDFAPENDRERKALAALED